MRAGSQVNVGIAEGLAGGQLKPAIDQNRYVVSGHGDPSGTGLGLDNFAVPEDRGGSFGLVVGLPNPVQVIGLAFRGRLGIFGKSDHLVPSREPGGVGPFVDAGCHLSVGQSQWRKLGIRMCAGQPEPESAVVAAFERHANRSVLLGVGSPNRHLIGVLEILHVDAENLRRYAVGFAQPRRFPILVDRHERRVIDGGVGARAPAGSSPVLAVPSKMPECGSVSINSTDTTSPLVAVSLTATLSRLVAHVAVRHP